MTEQQEQPPSREERIASKFARLNARISDLEAEVETGRARIDGLEREIAVAQHRAAEASGGLTLSLERVEELERENSAMHERMHNTSIVAQTFPTVRLISIVASIVNNQYQIANASDLRLDTAQVDRLADDIDKRLRLLSSILHDIPV